MNDLKDQFKYLVAGYYGMFLVDEYPLKEFVIRDIKEYIENFIQVNPIDNYDYKKEALIIKDETTDRVKLQDLLLVLHKIGADLEVELVVKEKLRKLGRKDYL